MRRRTVEDWRRAVFKARVNPGVQVLLLKMADHMRDNRQVSVPRERLADELGVHPQRIADKIKEAKDAGWLDKVGGGYRGVTATYQGLFPGEERVRDSGTHSGPERVRRTSTQSTPETGTHSKPECVPHGGYATTTADLLLPGQPRNGGTKDEQMRGRSSDHLPPDFWTREPPDLEEPEPYAEREESA